jgi:hypothetical protein
MIPALGCAIALAVLTAVRQPDPDHPFRGSQESVAPRLNHSSQGMTLEALHGLPLVRPTWSAPPRVWMYQPPVVIYPAARGGLGGYKPPGVGRYRSWGFWGW